jgi:hexosaminidase
MGLLMTRLQEETKYQANPNASKKIHFNYEENAMPNEGYSIEITTDNIILTANSESGFFYSLQTLFQLFDVSEKYENSIMLPTLKITDYPAFKYRGVHLDVCRHYYPKEFIYKYLDMMAAHKMNVFHWHLTEDQGWRIEIKKYPKLTEISSKRSETVVKKNFDPFIGDGKPIEGYYSQEDIKDIVKYARNRNITIIPEIEMPGHALAALAAYPELSCTGGPFEVGKKWGVYDDVYCAGNEEVFIFLQNVLDEVIELFPSKYIHIGGDECPKTRWKECPKCQQRMKDEGLADEHELQSYFIKRIEKYLNAKGKIIIGWDEILEGGLAPNAVVMSWRGESGGIEAANQNHNVIMTPNSTCYFDHYQSDNTDQEPFAIGGLTTLEDVYLYNPIPGELPEDKKKYILGVQSNVWTEYMKTSEHVEYMLFPRLCALSEVAWTNPKDRNYKIFMDRLKIHKTRLEKMEINYRKF